MSDDTPERGPERGSRPTTGISRPPQRTLPPSASVANRVEPFARQFTEAILEERLTDLQRDMQATVTAIQSRVDAARIETETRLAEMSARLSDCERALSLSSYRIGLLNDLLDRAHVGRIDADRGAP